MFCYGDKLQLSPLVFVSRTFFFVNDFFMNTNHEIVIVFQGILHTFCPMSWNFLKLQQKLLVQILRRSSFLKILHDLRWRGTKQTWLACHCSWGGVWNEEVSTTLSWKNIFEDIYVEFSILLIALGNTQHSIYDRLPNRFLIGLVTTFKE